MADRAKNEEKPTQETEEKKQKSGYGNWLFRKEGTKAEPWPTAEELWKDPEVKQSIDAHNESVKAENSKKYGSSRESVGKKGLKVA